MAEPGRPILDYRMPQHALTQRQRAVRIVTWIALAVHPETIVAVERPGGHRSHDRTVMSILQADGTVYRLDAPQAEHILRELQAGHNLPRPRMPSAPGPAFGAKP